MDLLIPLTTMSRRLGVAWVAAFAIATIVGLGPAVVHAEADLKRALELTCQARMSGLAEAETRNSRQIEWEIAAGGVRGTYLGYAPDFTCRLGAAENDPRTARLSYEEVVYEKSGPNAAQAANAVPRPKEIRDVTVVLVYRDGSWQ